MLPAPTWALTCSSVSSDTPSAHWDEQLGHGTRDEIEPIFYCPVILLAGNSVKHILLFCATLLCEQEGAQVTFRITKDIIKTWLNMAHTKFTIKNVIYNIKEII